MDGLIVNVALTGCVHRKADNPALPVTAAEVAADAKRCADEGATMFHVHARDSAGNPAWGAGVYWQYVDAVRRAVPGCVVAASCSGRHGATFEERSAAVHAGPDLGSLTLGSWNHKGASVVNEPPMIEALARVMGMLGVRPELAAFEVGHLAEAQWLAERGLLPVPFWANLFLGVLPCRWPWLAAMEHLLPDGALWAGAGLGACQHEAARWAVEMGGHARVGLEDCLWTPDGEPATNPGLVARVVALGRALGREPADAREALFG